MPHSIASDDARRQYVLDIASNLNLDVARLTAVNVDLLAFFDQVVNSCHQVLQTYAQAQSEAVEVSVAAGAAAALMAYKTNPTTQK